MKKRDVITIIITALVLAAILAGCLYLANRHRSGDISALLTPFEYFDNKVYACCIDTKTDELFSISDIFDLSKFADPDNCTVGIGNIDNSILYLSCLDKTSKEVHYFKYNILTEQISKIESESNFDVRPHSGNFYASGKYLYYLAYDHSEEITNYLCRVPVSGGEEEVIAEYPDNSEKLCFVINNKVITRNSNSIFVYDLRKNRKSMLWDSDKNGYTGINSDLQYYYYMGIDSDLQYYNGKLYFLTIPKNNPEVVCENEEFLNKWGTTSNSLLVALDMKTKKAVPVLDAPIDSFYLTKDKIYYIPKEYGIVQKSRTEMPRFSSLTLYSCSYDGNDIAAICTVENIWMHGILFINEEKAYVTDAQAETAKQLYVVIDIKSGETKTVQRKK